MHDIPGLVDARLYRVDSKPPLIHRGNTPPVGGSMQMNGTRCIVVRASSQAILFEGSESECVAFADRAVLNQIGEADLFIYTPRLRVSREYPEAKARHLSTVPRG